ncbi:MAG TPA: Na+:solute symporter, partial [Thermoanaerobaculia bacterium]|nr:Na+:solute symporter [Thermoanaerobaculia bacterium]
MNLTVIDWAIVFAYFALSIGIGFAFTKKGGESLEEYFVAGRKVPWWLAGAAMIATTFAADTPLVVTGLVAAHGVAGNWIWWNFVMSGTLTVFLYARLWRRAKVMTDVEFAEIRYSGKPATFLRGFRALYLALPINLIILGWVTLAMVKILQISLGIRPLWAVGLCFVITVGYSAAAGMWAVLWTDLVQLVIKMTAVILLAYFAVKKVGGIVALEEGLAKHFGSVDAAISFLPPAGSAWMPAIALFTFLGVQWWAAWYPGAEPGGGGYVAQRIFSAKTERDGILATLFFNVGHYALRPWPWILTGLATVLLYPAGVLVNGNPDHEAAYVQAMVDLMPAGWKGFMLAGFAAAYMSTVGTHLNWGASYLVGDVYKRFLRRGASEKHYVAVSRWTTVLLFLLSIVVTLNLSSIEGAWRFLLALGSGTGLVLILRWYWWRVNAWSEISAMVTSMAVSLAAFAFVPKGTGPGGEFEQQAIVMLVTVVATTLVWLAVTFLTAPEPDATLDAFYTRVRPGGPGWARVSARLGFGREPIPGGAMSFLNWGLGILLVYTALFGIGKIVFGRILTGFELLDVAVVAFVLIMWNLKREE